MEEEGERERERMANHMDSDIVLVYAEHEEELGNTRADVLVELIK